MLPCQLLGLQPDRWQSSLRLQGSEKSLLFQSWLACCLCMSSCAMQSCERSLNCPAHNTVNMVQHTVATVQSSTPRVDHDSKYIHCHPLIRRSSWRPPPAAGANMPDGIRLHLELQTWPATKPCRLSIRLALATAANLLYKADKF